MVNGVKIEGVQATGRADDRAPPALVLVVIGDLIDSRRAPDRSALQARFIEATRRCNVGNAELRSPYTVTLGDEFQVVLGGARHLFCDLTRLTAELLGAPDPVTAEPSSTNIRYSIAVGKLTTPINPSQAIAMDGPAFYAARLGIEQLKQSRATFLVSGLGEALDELCNGLLSLVSHEMERWQRRRHWILVERMRRAEVTAIAERLGVSPAAVYKNLTRGGVDLVCRNLLAVARVLDAALQSAS